MKKLTLSADESVVEEAKRVAREQGTSVSALFSRWIGALAHRGQEKGKIPPNSITARATGIVRLPQDQSERDIVTDALIEKYGVDRS